MFPTPYCYFNFDLSFHHITAITTTPVGLEPSAQLNELLALVLAMAKKQNITLTFNPNDLDQKGRFFFSIDTDASLTINFLKDIVAKSKEKGFISDGNAKVMQVKIDDFDQFRSRDLTYR